MTPILLCVHIDPKANPDVVGRRYEGDGIEFLGFSNRHPCPVVKFEVAGADDRIPEELRKRLELDANVVMYDENHEG